MQINIISNSADFTQSLGKKFSRILSKSNVILFSGELGGGKTTFISGLAEGFGVKENLSSPSFTILNEYHIDNRLKFIHADLYRLENIDDIDNTGLDDYLYDGFSIICIEWGDEIEDHDMSGYPSTNLSYLIDSSNVATKRKITFNSDSRYWDIKLSRFKNILEKDRK